VLPHLAFGQGCSVRLEPHFSTYQSIATDGDNISQSVTIQGYASFGVGLGCPMNTAIHTPKVYNKIGSTGGWYSGTSNCATCYYSYTKNLQVVGVPGVLYLTAADEEMYCSMAGTFFDAGQVSKKVMVIIGANCFQTNPQTQHPYINGSWGDPTNFIACGLSENGPDLPLGGSCHISDDPDKNCYYLDNSNGTCTSYCPGKRRVADSACTRFEDKFPLTAVTVTGPCHE
jgi:hypothetical protein